MLTMLLIIVLAMDNQLTVSPLCWMLVAVYAVFRIMWAVLKEMTE